MSSSSRSDTQPTRAGTLCRFADSQSGVAAVEFAFILPIMLLIYFGMAQVTMAVSADRKLTLLVRNLADLVGRTTDLSNDGRDEIFKAVSSIMHPFDGSKVRMTITSVVVRENPQTKQIEGTVCWSEGWENGEALPSPAGQGTPVDVPDARMTANQSYIVARAVTVFTPTVGYGLTGPVDLGEEITWPVRGAQEVSRNGRKCLS